MECHCRSSLVSFSILVLQLGSFDPGHPAVRSAIKCPRPTKSTPFREQATGCPWVHSSKSPTDVAAIAKDGPTENG